MNTIFHADSNYLVLLLCGIVLVFAVGWVSRPLRRRYNLTFANPEVGNTVELVLLFLLVPVLVGWPLVAPAMLGGMELDNLRLPLRTDANLWLLYCAVIAMAWLVTSRLFRTKAAFLITCIGITLFGFGHLIWMTAVPKFQAIRGADDQHLFADELFVPSAFMAVRIFVWALLTVLGGLYAVRRTFSWPVYLLGCPGAGAAAYCALMPFWSWPLAWLAVFAFTCLAALLIVLPYQRAAIERIVGFALDRGTSFESEEQHGSSVSHFALLLLGCFVAGSAGVNFFEREQMRILTEGPRKMEHTAAEVNAYTDLKPLLAESASNLLRKTQQPVDFKLFTRLYGEITSATRAEIFGSGGWEAFRLYNSQLREYTDAVEHASRADYLEVPHPFALSAHIHVMQIMRLLGVRSQISFYENRSLDATNDIRTLYRLAELLTQAPALEQQSLAGYCRSVANGAAYNGIVQAGTDEQAMLALSTLMDGVVESAHAPFNLEALRRGESGIFLPVVPNAEWVLPDATLLENSQRYHLIGWINFDLVRIAAALELYHIQNAEYPQDLQEITPAYLRRLPLDPIEGKEYQYRVLPGGAYELRCPSIPDSWGMHHLRFPFLQ